MSQQQQSKPQPSKPLTKAQLFVKQRIEPILKFDSNSGKGGSFLNMVQPLKKHIEEWGLFKKGCLGTDARGYIKQLQGVIEAIYHEVKASEHTEVLDSDSEGMIDTDEILRPEDEDDKDFVIPDDQPLSEEELETTKKKKGKRRRIQEHEEEEAAHVEMYAAMAQDDDLEDEAHLKVLLEARPKAEPAQIKLQHRKNDDDPVVSKPAVVPTPVVNRASLPTADLADVPKEFKTEEEFLDVDDESVAMSDEEEEVKDEGTESEELSEEEGENQTSNKKKKQRYEQPECRYYKVGEKFELKGQEYEVTHSARKHTPMDENDAIDWELVTYDHVSVCKGPPAGKKAPESDYNAFVFSKSHPPHMISLKQAQKIDAQLERKDREINRQDAIKHGNIKKQKNGEINTYMPMNYFRSLEKKRLGRNTKAMQKQPQVLKDTTNQRNNKSANDKTVAIEMLKKFTMHKELFMTLPQAWDEEFANTINNMNSEKLRTMFMPGGDSFIKEYKDSNDENIGEAVRNWTRRWGSSKTVRKEFPEKDLLKFFIQHMVFINPGCKTAFVKRLKELATGP